MTLYLFQQPYRQTELASLPLQTFLVNGHLNGDVRKLVIAMGLGIRLDCYAILSLRPTKVRRLKRQAWMKFGVLQTEAGWKKKLEAASDENDKKELNDN